MALARTFRSFIIGPDRIGAPLLYERVQRHDPNEGAQEPAPSARPRSCARTLLSTIARDRARSLWFYRHRHTIKSTRRKAWGVAQSDRAAGARECDFVCLVVIGSERAVNCSELESQRGRGSDSCPSTFQSRISRRPGVRPTSILFIIFRFDRFR